jgi:hypothetical protein
MASQTEFERGFLAGVHKMKMVAIVELAGMTIVVPKQEKEE